MGDSFAGLQLEVYRNIAQLGMCSSARGIGWAERACNARKSRLKLRR